MLRSLIVLVAILMLAYFVVQPATGQTIPPPVHLPLIQPGGSSVNQTPTPISTPTRTFTPTPTSTPTRTATPTNTPTQQPAGNITIRKETLFEPFEGSNGLDIVGEVVNDTTGDVQFVKVNAVLRDANGAILTGGDGYSMIDTLSPAMASPFRVSLFNVPDGWQSYELTATYSQASHGPIGLDLSDIETYFDGFDAFHVRGNVRNQTGETREFVKIFCLFLGR